MTSFAAIGGKTNAAKLAVSSTVWSADVCSRAHSALFVGVIVGWRRAQNRTDTVRLFVILHGMMEMDAKMAFSLQHWRHRNALTQVNAAALLGVSQPYLSLLEKGARPLTATVRSRMKNVRQTDRPASDDRFRRQLSALGYPKFAHITPARPKSSPDSLLVSVLAGPNVDARVVEALPWLVRRYADQLDLDWLVRHAKLQNLQNRLGFVLQTAAVETPKVVAAVRELERARLLQEATLCWDSMPAATREWMRVHRAPSAEHWNILTRLQAEDVDSAA